MMFLSGFFCLQIHYCQLFAAVGQALDRVISMNDIFITKEELKQSETGYQWDHFNPINPDKDDKITLAELEQNKESHQKLIEEFLNVLEGKNCQKTTHTTSFAVPETSS